MSKPSHQTEWEQSETAIAMIKINDNLSLSEPELKFMAIRSSGPGGQNVNRVKTAVQLRFSVNSSACLPARVKERLHRVAGRLINQQGELVIEARRFRTQQANKNDAVERLARLIRKAAFKPKVRMSTSPGRKGRERRLQAKRQRAEVKRRRHPPSAE